MPPVPGIVLAAQAGMVAKTAPFSDQVTRSVEVRQWIRPGASPIWLVVNR